MNAESLAKLASTLRVEEGCRLTAYLDSAGVITVGYGHNLQAHPIPQALADQWLAEDVAAATRDVEGTFPWVKTLDEVRQRAIVDLCFNLGINGLLKFSRAGGTLEAVRQGQYDVAATRLLSNERWVSEVGLRAERIAAMLRFGEDPA